MTANYWDETWLGLKMPKESLLSFFERLGQLDEFSYLYGYLRVQLAPTLYCNKVGTLLNLSMTHLPLHKIFLDKQKYFEEALGVQSFILKESLQGVLVYFFKKDSLEAHLRQEEIQLFLKSYQYKNPANLYEALKTLKKHFQSSCPHEVGIFLGYPTCDVVGFSTLGGKRCKFKGYWCVYQNVDFSKKIFAQYDAIKLKTMDQVMDEYQLKQSV